MSKRCARVDLALLFIRPTLRCPALYSGATSKCLDINNPVCVMELSGGNPSLPCWEWAWGEGGRRQQHQPTSSQSGHPCDPHPLMMPRADCSLEPALRWLKWMVGILM